MTRYEALPLPLLVLCIFSSKFTVEHYQLAPTTPSPLPSPRLSSVQAQEIPSKRSAAPSTSPPTMKYNKTTRTQPRAGKTVATTLKSTSFIAEYIV
jgi:hypothetical protein